MEFTREELQTIADALNQLLGMHISAMYDVQEIAERIEDYLEQEEEDE